MQETFPAGKWDLSLLLVLAREGRVVKGKESKYLCSSLCQPAKKGSSFFSFWCWLRTHGAPPSGCQENAEKSSFTEMKTCSYLQPVLYWGRAVTLRNAWSQLWRQSSYILRGAWTQISFEGEKILLPSSSCQRRSQEVNQRTLGTNLW